MAISVPSAFGVGLISGLEQQQAARGSVSGNSFTTTTNVIALGNCVQPGTMVFGQAVAGSPVERVQASLPRTLRAELQEQVDAWLPKWPDGEFWRVFI